MSRIVLGVSGEEDGLQALVGTVAVVPTLTPAKDLDPTRAAMQAARSDLVTARTHLSGARAHARAALDALGR